MNMTLAGTLVKPTTNLEDEYTFLEPVRNTKVALPCRHNSCGTVFMISPNHLRSRGCKCKNCDLFKQQFGITPTVNNPVMKVHCSHHHCFRVLKKHFYKKIAGEIKCPICEKLKYWDPIYKDAQVQFIFNFLGGHVIDR